MRGMSENGLTEKNPSGDWMVVWPLKLLNSPSPFASAATAMRALLLVPVPMLPHTVRAIAGTAPDIDSAFHAEAAPASTLFRTFVERRKMRLSTCPNGTMFGVTSVSPDQIMADAVYPAGIWPPVYTGPLHAVVPSVLHVLPPGL